MRCNNCGMDYIMDNSTNCPKCGASLVQPGYQQPPQQYQQYPDQQNQQQPQGQYQQYPDQQNQQQPQGGYYQQQPPMPSQQRVPTVRKVDLTELLIVVSGLLLMGVGFWNLSYIAFNAPVVYVLMGIVALAVGLLMMLVVIMPAPFKGMAQIMDILLLVFAIIFIL